MELSLGGKDAEDIERGEKQTITLSSTHKKGESHNIQL